VSAVAALRLVQEGAIDLDTDINAYLTSWQVPENEFLATEKVTLQRCSARPWNRHPCGARCDPTEVDGTGPAGESHRCRGWNRSWAVWCLLDLAHIDAVPVRSRTHRPAHVQHGWPVLGSCVFGGKLCAGPTDQQGESSGGAESGVKRCFLDTGPPLSL
jgi:hypothetical protein